MIKSRRKRGTGKYELIKFGSENLMHGVWIIHYNRSLCWSFCYDSNLRLKVEPTLKQRRWMTYQPDLTITTLSFVLRIWDVIAGLDSGAALQHTAWRQSIPSTLVKRMRTRKGRLCEVAGLKLAWSVGVRMLYFLTAFHLHKDCQVHHISPFSLRNSRLLARNRSCT